MCSWSVVSGEQFHCSQLLPLALIHSVIPETWEDGIETDVPFAAEHSIITFSVPLEQSWVSINMHIVKKNIPFIVFTINFYDVIVYI